jgi:NADH-quinone oxidoreductase subunit J
MKPLLPLIIFWLFGALAILGAIAVAILPNLIRSAFALFLSLLSIAAIYLLAGADFLAYTQIIIYVGAILILLLFGIMLTKVKLI